jgi:hypothetical protein
LHRKLVPPLQMIDDAQHDAFGHLQERNRIVDVAPAPIGAADARRHALADRKT